MEEKKKNNSSLVVLACLVVAVLCCVGFLVFKQFSKTNTPKERFINAIDKVTKLEKLKKFDTYSGEFTITANIKSDLLDESILDLINKLYLGGKINVDTKNNKSYIELDSKYDNENLINGKIYVNEEDIYMYLNDAFDKWIKLENNGEEINLNVDFGDIANFDAIEDFLKNLKDVFSESLKDEYFTKEKEDDLTKITLTINKDNAYDLFKDLITNMNKNTKFKDSVKKMFDTDVNEAFEELENSFKEVDKDSFEMEPITLDIYLDKNDNIKKISINTTTEETPIRMDINITDEDNFNMNMYVMGINYMSFDVKTSKEGDTKNVTITFDMMSMITAKFNINTIEKYDTKFEDVDISNSVEIDSLSENELNTISEKITNNKGLTKLIEALQNVQIGNPDLIEY